MRLSELPEKLGITNREAKMRCCSQPRVSSCTSAKREKLQGRVVHKVPNNACARQVLNSQLRPTYSPIDRPGHTHSCRPSPQHASSLLFGTLGASGALSALVSSSGCRSNLRCTWPQKPGAQATCHGSAGRQVAAKQAWGWILKVLKRARYVRESKEGGRGTWHKHCE